MKNLPHLILPADHAKIISIKDLMEKTYIHMFNNCYFYIKHALRFQFRGILILFS